MDSQLIIKLVVEIICCFLPLVVLVLVSKLHFKLELKYQFVAILLGLIAVLPIALIQYKIPDLRIASVHPVLYSLLKSLILYGLLEEVIKMAFLIPLPHKKLNEFNFLLLSFVMGLALGCFESVAYFLDYSLKATNRGATLLYGQIFLRIFTADIIHMCCTGLCGLFLFSIRQKNKKIIIIIFAILIHGIYDFFAGYNNILRAFSYLAVLLSIIECRVKYSALKDGSEEASGDVQFRE